jgi:hypothetical protein
MITKQDILEDFWEQFPHYKDRTPTYEDILFREEEIREWNKDWIQDIWHELVYNIKYNIETLEDLEEYIKLK